MKYLVRKLKKELLNYTQINKEELVMLERIKYRLELMNYNPITLITYLCYWKWHQPDLSEANRILQEIEAMYQ